MANTRYGDAVSDLETAGACKGEEAEGYWLARAHVNALLAVADMLDGIDTRLMHIRDAMEDRGK